MILRFVFYVITAAALFYVFTWFLSKREKGVAKKQGWRIGVSLAVGVVVVLILTIMERL